MDTKETNESDFVSFVLSQGRYEDLKTANQLLIPTYQGRIVQRIVDYRRVERSAPDGVRLAFASSEVLMALLIHEHTTRVCTPEGELFSARTWGEQEGHLWHGWLEFVPAAPGAPTLRTERETSQPSRQALEYWAEGLEPLYFEGAFARAQIVE